MTELGFETPVKSKVSQQIPEPTPEQAKLLMRKREAKLRLARMRFNREWASRYQGLGLRPVSK